MGTQRVHFSLLPCRILFILLCWYASGPLEKQNSSFKRLYLDNRVPVLGSFKDRRTWNWVYFWSGLPLHDSSQFDGAKGAHSARVCWWWTQRNGCTTHTLITWEPGANVEKTKSISVFKMRALNVHFPLLLCCILFVLWCWYVSSQLEKQSSSFKWPYLNKW